MAELLAQREALRSAAAMVQQVARELTDERTKLDGKARGFLGSGWSGVAANDFITGMNEWDQGVAEVLAALGEVGQMIAATERDFGMTDEVGAAMMSRTQGSVSPALGRRMGGSAAV